MSKNPKNSLSEKGDGLDLVIHSAIKDSSSSSYTINFKQSLTPAIGDNVGILLKEINKQYYLPRLVVEINYASRCLLPGGLEEEDDNDKSDDDSDIIITSSPPIP